MVTRMEYSNKQNPSCEQKRTDCKSNSHGRCRALEDTHFKRPCPFYKKREKKGDNNA